MDTRKLKGIDGTINAPSCFTCLYTNPKCSMRLPVNTDHKKGLINNTCEWYNVAQNDWKKYIKEGNMESVTLRSQLESYIKCLVKKDYPEL